MTQPPGTIERAYQLARMGTCRTIDDIVRQLSAERYDSPQAHLAGKSLRLELRSLIKARKELAAETQSGADCGSLAPL
ncbi:hypothetical protein DMC47_36515 [Nostoc sp. 3335mG]|nr:hypothetical protein DMC47_36515 [Nostoc sp. 3335mG]